MPDLEPYSLEAQQAMVRDAVDRSEGRHAMWRTFEILRRTGSLQNALTYGRDHVEAGKLDILATLDQESVNLILPHMTLMLTTIVSREPAYVVTPYGGGEVAEAGAETAKSVVDYFWLRTHATEDLKDATADMLHLGPGFLKVGWNFELREEDKTSEELEQEFADMLAADSMLAFREGRAPTPDDELAGRLSLTREITELNEPYVSYVSPYDVFVPTNARRMRETRWVAHRITLPIDEVKANPEFADVEVIPDGSPNVNDKWVAEWRRRAAEVGTGEHSNHESLETATFFEFYDLRTHHLTVFQIDADEPLFDDEIPWDHRHPPFVMLRNYNDGGEEFWPFGDIENVARIQNSFNEFLTKQMGNALRAGNKYFVRKSLVDDDMRAGLESDLDDVVIEIDDDNVNMQDVIHSVERKALSGDVYQAKAELEDFIRRVLGINDFQAGGVGADRMSATAAAVVDGIATLRAQDKVESVENGAADCANLILLLAQQFLTEPTIIRVATPEGAVWPEVDSSLIQGEYLFRVEGGSTKAMNPATREQRGQRLLTEVLPQVMELAMAVGQPIDPMPVIRTALRDMGYQPDTIIVPSQQPQLPPEVDESGQPLPGDEGALPAAVPGAPAAPAQAQAAADIAI